MAVNTDELNRTVFISDNLPFLRALDTESVDLVVIDPPFGKQQTFSGTLKPPLADAELEQEYDLLSQWGIQNEDDAYEQGLEFPDQTGTTASFQDIWNFRWQVTRDEWDALGAVCRPAQMLVETTRFTHSDDIAGYIAFMAMRMIEIHRVLKPTGSVYLHCDHEANGYLRQMMDAVFGQRNFKCEIVWRRQNSNNSVKTTYGNITDTILFYVKSKAATWNQPYYTERSEVEKGRYRKDKDGRLYKTNDLTAPKPTPNRIFAWRGAIPKNGWRYSKEKLEELYSEGRILFKRDGKPRLDGHIQYLDEMPSGGKVQNLWDDIPRVPNTAAERTGYPTQKPQALARRIIEASTLPGDIVVDCFAGCAYVPVAAELTGRRWIACDMSPRAWTVVRRQFHKQPDLRIETEGAYPEADGGVQPDLGPERIIRVRGPHDLPEPSAGAAQPTLGIRDLPEIQFRQRPLETRAEIWAAFIAEWGTACWYCGQQKAADPRELPLDHVEPNRKDGSNDDCWNRALSCSPCNSDKSNRMTPEETIHKAREAGRIATDRLMQEQIVACATRLEWAKDRWERLPRKAPIL